MSGQLYSIRALVLATGVMPDAIRQDIRQGRIKASKPGTEWLFTAAQLAAAKDFYAARGRTAANDQAV